MTAAALMLFASCTLPERGELIVRVDGMQRGAGGKT